MTEKEALKLALEALKYPLNQSHENFNVDMAELLAHRAITALREALAEQPAQQEPVVWMYQNKSTHQVSFQKHMRAFVDHGVTYETPLYTTPPAQRTWVGLTDEEMDDCWNKLFGTGNYNRRNVYRAVEAKLKEKNNG